MGKIVPLHHKPAAASGDVLPVLADAPAWIGAHMHIVVPSLVGGQRRGTHPRRIAADGKFFLGARAAVRTGNQARHGLSHCRFAWVPAPASSIGKPRSKRSSRSARAT